MSILRNLAGRIRTVATGAHEWRRDDSLPGFRCSCGETVDIEGFVEAGDGQAHEIGDTACRDAYRDFSEPYLIDAEPGHEEAAAIEALLTDFGVDFYDRHRWWHPDSWTCETCHAGGVGGAHVCRWADVDDD